MARIMAIDYGAKRTGLAVTDPLQIIANGLATVPTHELLSFLEDYMAAEAVEAVVIGMPEHADGSPTELVPHIHGLARKLQQLFPGIGIVFQDERLTSVMAKAAILSSGVGRKKRQDKGLVDKVAATIILQAYLEETKY